LKSSREQLPRGDDITYTPSIIDLLGDVESRSINTICVFIGTASMFTFFYKDDNWKGGLLVYCKVVLEPILTMCSSDYSLYDELMFVSITTSRFVDLDALMPDRFSEENNR